VKLADRNNELFINFLNAWLVNDKVASYFVFDLRGFEYLLDTIGIGHEPENAQEEQKEEVPVRKESVDISLAPVEALKTLGNSDLSLLLNQEESIDSKPPEGEQVKKVKFSSKDQAPGPKKFSKTQQPQLQEFSKQMVMVANNGNDNINSYQKTDWSVNKRGYKHRIIIKNLTGELRSEYWILFKLQEPVLLREIQISFTNYWATDQEVYSEPLSVLVEAGLEETNLNLVASLQQVKDDGFAQVQSSLFGKNLMSFQPDLQGVSIEDDIERKLASLQNYKVQFLRFSMRRHVMPCVENSPLATKFMKQPAFAINFISLQGYNLEELGDYTAYIREEQKKSALEVLSLICSGEFSKILNVIANQEQTIEKIKNSFDLLSSLASVKGNLIEPTFISIATHNNEMGDWMIGQFLAKKSIAKHAKLVGELLMCNADEIPRRLKVLQDHLL